MKKWILIQKEHYWLTQSLEIQHRVPTLSFFTILLFFIEISFMDEKENYWDLYLAFFLLGVLALTSLIWCFCCGTCIGNEMMTYFGLKKKKAKKREYIQLENVEVED
ncbi:hypothetical protein K502DRAFT_351200 [Neoconidiobolus thromboides FSU 785]|nr:hypothetical protein K502DRAFT_351200 [Neoconidiobolus thromboides FSU 785]